MNRITITEASKAFGVSTNTIRRRVRKHELTPHGKPQGDKIRYYFDVADLVRVFGEPDAGGTFNVTLQDSDGGIPRHVPQGVGVQELRSRLTKTERQLADLQSQITERDSQITELRHQVRERDIKMEAQSAHLHDLRQILAPRLETPSTVGARMARYMGDMVRSYKGPGKKAAE